jgi:hypothetical protein
MAPLPGLSENISILEQWLQARIEGRALLVHGEDPAPRRGRPTTSTPDLASGGQSRVSGVIAVDRAGEQTNSTFHVDPPGIKAWVLLPDRD